MDREDIGQGNADCRVTLLSGRGLDNGYEWVHAGMMQTYLWRGGR